MADENIEVILYKRYVDDSNLVVDDFKDDTNDEMVMKKISQIADSIDPSIRSTYDYGSKYEDGKLPMLDLKIWIGKDLNGVWKILHSHYMKDVSSRYLIHTRSSHPDSMKVNVLVNEGLRILRNTSIHLGWEEARDQLQYFVKRMQFSGYDMNMRAKIISKIIQKWDNILIKYNETGKMFRSRQEQYNERKASKNKKKSAWYDQSKYDGTLFVDVTENSEMMHEVQRVCKKNKMKVKVIEKMRNTVKTEIQRSNPFKTRNCGRNDCVLCKLGMNIECRTRGCVYEIECTDCTRKYRGQTGRSIYERINEHFKD